MKHVLIFFLTSFLLNNPLQAGNSIKGNGQITTTKHPLTAAQNLHISGLFKVYLIQDNSTSVEFETDQNLQQYLKIEDDGKNIHISLADVSIKKFNKLTLRIHAAKLSSLRFDGLGSIVTPNTLNLQDFELNVEGMGKVNLKLNGRNLTSKISGMCKITLSGNMQNANIEHEGTGMLSASRLICQSVTLVMDGIGKASVRGEKSIDITNKGIGLVTFRGSAKNIKTRNQGIGKIVRDDEEED